MKTWKWQITYLSAKRHLENGTLAAAQLMSAFMFDTWQTPKLTLFVNIIAVYF